MIEPQQGEAESVAGTTHLAGLRVAAHDRRTRRRRRSVDHDRQQALAHEPAIFGPRRQLLTHVAAFFPIDAVKLVEAILEENRLLDRKVATAIGHAERQAQPDIVLGRAHDQAAALQGWDLYADEVSPGPNDSGSETATKLTLKRSLGPLAFDLGICIVLITLPTLAIITAVQVITRRKAFQMPFLTWYAAMLFAVVPLRNILPGAPPPGAWIDVALVLWVLVALVTAMVMAVVSWQKQVD